jgi:predicted nucleotidyltransferase
VDILFGLESGRRLMDQIALGLDWEDLLGCQVDVVTAKALPWSSKDNIVQDAAPVERLCLCI